MPSDSPGICADTMHGPIWPPAPPYGLQHLAVVLYRATDGTWEPMALYSPEYPPLALYGAQQWPYIGPRTHQWPFIAPNTHQWPYMVPTTGPV